MKSPDHRQALFEFLKALCARAGKPSRLEIVYRSPDALDGWQSESEGAQKHDFRARMQRGGFPEIAQSMRLTAQTRAQIRRAREGDHAREMTIELGGALPQSWLYVFDNSIDALMSADSACTVTVLRE